MNNQKPFLIGGIALLGVIALILAFMAGKNYNYAPRAGGYDGSKMMRDSDGSFGDGRNGGRGMRGQMMNREMEFIDIPSLSADQKTKFETLQKDHQQKMQDLMQSFRSGSGTSDSEFKTQSETLWKEYTDGIKEFVSSDKLSDFENFVSEGMPQNLGQSSGKGRNLNQ